MEDHMPEILQPVVDPIKAESKKDERPQPTYKITNVVRRVQSRLRRAAAPGRGRFKQFVCGKRILRKQTLSVTEDQFKEYEHQLFEQIKAGVIQVVTPEGRLLFADVAGNILARKGMDVRMVAPTKGYKPPKKAEAKKEDDPAKVSEPEPIPEPEPAPEPEPDPEPMDVLTELPGIGLGRARKLEEAGVKTFRQIAEMAPGKLVKLLGPTMTEDQAAEICDAASEKEG
jgi:predicted flap endonuclease-1-like 5' DNA nuclease